MQITTEQHNKEDHFAMTRLILPAAAVAISATTAYSLFPETMGEVMNYNQLIALDIGAVVIALAGVYWMIKASRACEANH